MKYILFKLKKRFVLFLIFFLICFLSFPGILNCDDVDYPSYTGFVNDYVGLLDSSSRDRLEALAAQIESDTGSEIAVAIVDSLQGITKEEYAVELFEKWGIGKEKEDNGLLILICTEGEPGKRPLRIEVGYGLEGVITDLEAGDIIDKIIVPNFSSQKFYTGLNDAMMAIADQIYVEEGLEPLSAGGGGIAAVTESPVSSFTGFLSGLPATCMCCFPFPLVIIIIIVLVSFFRRRCPSCRKFTLKTKTTILKAATYTAAGKKLVERICSNCGYSDKKEVTIPRKSRTSYWSGGSGVSSGGGFSGGGGFGGFGGGSSGGGGASGGW
jgi:uncharacterized protein